MSLARPEKRSLTLQGHRTSVTLEPPFWDALRRLAAHHGVSINALAAKIDAERARIDPEVTLASALRVTLLSAAREGRC
ncbi:MAG: ribbon-helix-helix domain-containing protein [Rhodobacteraceae bacterium]|nr:ribbon-helix-helix domain-containing protein [Paracoccaceae bacterium]